MSLRNKRSSRSGRSFSTGSFTSPALGSSTNPKTSNPELVTAVSINKSLLAPLNLEIDPKIQALRNQEKEEIKGLNNRFVSFIDKVRLLEQQNKLLDTKWKLLQEQSVASSDVEPFFNSYISSLQRQLEQLSRDKHALGVENENTLKLVVDYREKMEDERNKKTDAENLFVVLKKDVDEGNVSLLHLKTTLSSMKDEIEFLKAIYDQELKELRESIQETSVVVQMDNSRDLNMDQIISNVKAHYEEIAASSKEETEIWYRTQFDQMAAQASQYDSQLHNTKDEVAHLKRQIIRLQNEISAVKSKVAKLKDGIDRMEAGGEAATLHATDRIRDLEEALKNAKLEMTKQIKDYQALMDIKMTLDIEISTYKKLLEGEECRMTLNHNNPVQICQAAPSRERRPRTSGPVLIKMTQTQNTSYN